MVIIFEFVIKGFGDQPSENPVRVLLSHSITVPSKQDETHPVSLLVMDAADSDSQM